MKIKYPIWITLFSLLLVLAPSVFAVGKPDGVGKNSTLKACQGREELVNNRATSLSRLATNMLQQFAAIAEKVQAYYTAKVVPGGKIVANYDSLVSDIQTKKAVAQTLLLQAQNHAASFACTSDNPKGKMTQFREDMRAVKSALKDYRTSIKNLIVAVHSLSVKPTKTGGEND